MDVVVCLKQVVDPELPAQEFAIDAGSRRQVRAGKALVISTYDENALEVALQLKDQGAATTVTALTIAPAAEAKDAIRLALAMGADKAVVVDEPRAPALLGVEKAALLAAALRRAGAFDLVLTGCESADWVERVVAPLLAEALEASCVTFVSRIEAGDGRVAARRLADDGVHTVEARLPAVISITSDESNRPRLPKIRDIMQAGKKPTETVPSAELTALPDALRDPGVDVREVTIPQRTTKCEFFEGEPADQAVALIQRLRAMKTI
ncbi:MAG TPA: electron transfer flavoprotein subunit beta/FixA family protein [bacterium]